MSIVDPAPKAWSIIAYTVADDYGTGNPLDAALVTELAAMCNAADFKLLSLALQVDFKKIPGVFRNAIIAPQETSRTWKPVPPEQSALWRPIAARLKHAKMVLQKNVVTVPAQPDRPTARHRTRTADVNSARGKVLGDFVRYAVKECPATSYVLFMYGHGSGPMGLYYDRDPNGRARTLRLNALAAAVRGSDTPVALVVFRDCYMNTMETAFELQGQPRYMIASQSEVPIRGIWPWPGMMGTLMEQPAAGDVALAVAQQLGDFLTQPENREPFVNAPISLVDTTSTEVLVEPLRELATRLDAARRDATRTAACGTAIRAARIGRNTHDDPGDPALLDLPTLCRRLAELAPDDVAAPARALADLIPGRLVVWHRDQQQGRHSGISIYCEPCDETLRGISNMVSSGALLASDRKYYRTLQLSVRTGWDRIALNPLEEPPEPA